MGTILLSSFESFILEGSVSSPTSLSVFQSTLKLSFREKRGVLTSLSLIIS